MIPTLHHGSGEVFVLLVLDPVMEGSRKSMQQLLALPTSILTGPPARHRIPVTEPIITRADADRECVSWDPQQPRAKVAHLAEIFTMIIYIFCLNSLGICSQTQLIFGQVEG